MCLYLTDVRHFLTITLKKELMKEPVIVQTEVNDKIRLEDKYDFNVRLTIALAEGGDYYLIIYFVDLTMEDFMILEQLSKLSRRLSITSEIIDNQDYNITHIVVTKFTTNNNLSTTWECLSDDPSSYETLTIE
jgi:hypothetical protein